MTQDDFRRIALGMTNTIEGAHIGHPDFRVNNGIFATLRTDKEKRMIGMVILTPDQQHRFVEEAPKAFVPETGAWGLQGCTTVRLETVDEELLGEAMTLAWRNLVEKTAAARPKGKAGTSRTSTAKTRRRKA